MWVASRWWSKALVLGGYLAVYVGYCVWASHQQYPGLWWSLGLLGAYGLYSLWWWWVGRAYRD